MLRDLVSFLGIPERRLTSQGLQVSALTERATKIGEHSEGNVYRLSRGSYLVEFNEARYRRTKACPLVHVTAADAQAAGTEGDTAAHIVAKALGAS